MKIAIVILNWNGKELLEKFLPAVVANSKDAVIYLADNASTDNSIPFVKTNYPEIKILKNPENGGYAKGYNDALQHVKEDIYCLLNSDIEVSKDWLNPILKEFQEDKKTAIVQPKILDYKNKNYFEYAGAAGGFIDKFGYPFCRGRIFNAIEKDNNQYGNENIFWASGACLFIKKEVFEKLNGFDESYFAHMEEIDLCWRAYNLGYLAKYVNASKVYHVGGATLQTNNPKKTYLNFRNSLFTLTKNASGNILALVFVRLILDGFAGIMFLFKGKIAHIIAIIKAHFSFYYHLPKLLSVRKILPKKKKYYYKTSIVWSYFVSKKRTFNNL